MAWGRGVARPVRFSSYAIVFGAILAFLILAHGPLLRLPYYWDELGQFIPASLDLFEQGRWIPVSTLPNAHPPGVMAYLAVFWSIFGYSIEATRIAMLLIAATGALAAFLLAIELGRGVPGTPAFSAIVLLCASPLFFSQSMLAQLDMPAMAFTAIALLLFLQNRFRASALACTVLVLVKETGIVVPALFGMWLLVERRRQPGWRQAFWFTLPLPALAVWLFALRASTGHWFGNGEFTQYNVFYPLNPVRLFFALFRRFYYLFIGSGHFIGTAVLLYAYRRMPVLRSRAWKIAGVLVAAQILLVSVLGGAVLERYLLPVLPIVYAAFALALQALQIRTRRLALAALLVCLSLANFINPPYPFPFENNLAFVSLVELQQDAAATIDLLPKGRVATAFPLTDAFRRPEFGFSRRKVPVVPMQDFHATEIARLVQIQPEYLCVFTDTWDPWNLLGGSPVGNILHRFYGYEPRPSTGQIERTLGMHSSRVWERHGLTMTLFERGAARNSRVRFDMDRRKPHQIVRKSSGTAGGKS